MRNTPRKQKLPLQNDVDWRLALKQRPFLGFFVLIARGSMLLAIVGTFLAGMRCLRTRFGKSWMPSSRSCAGKPTPSS